MSVVTLMFTSLGFVIPCCIYPSSIPCYLKSLLLITSTVSVLFWSNPARNSTIHKIDRILARTSIISFMVYNIIKNRKTLVLFSMSILLMLLSLYLSHHFSIRMKTWGGKDHIRAHGFAHFFGIIGIYATCLSSAE